LRIAEERRPILEAKFFKRSIILRIKMWGGGWFRQAVSLGLA